MKLPLLLLATTTCTGSNSVSDTATVVHFEPPVALRGGPGQRQARSTNTMGLFHLGGDNALFQEFTVDYYPYQNRTALLFSSDSGRTWAQPPGGDAYDSLSCMNEAFPGKGCSPAVTSPGCDCTWMVNPIATAPVHGVRGYRVPMDVTSEASSGLVDYNTSTIAEFSATPSGEFMLNQNTGLPIRFVGLPRAWDGSEVQLNPESACNSIVLPDGSHLMCALVGSAGCWGASTSASCMALNRTVSKALPFLFVCLLPPFVSQPCLSLRSTGLIRQWLYVGTGLPWPHAGRSTVDGWRQRATLEVQRHHLPGAVDLCGNQSRRSERQQNPGGGHTSLRQWWLRRRGGQNRPSTRVAH